MVCSDFQGFCPDFLHIKTFGDTLAPRILYYCLQAMFTGKMVSHNNSVTTDMLPISRSY